MSDDRRQFVRYLFLSLSPEWRRLPAATQSAQKADFVRAITQFHGRLLLRPYSLVGTRGDCDLMLWQVTETLETLQAAETAIFSTGLGQYFRIAHSYLGLTRRSEYEFGDIPGAQPSTLVNPSEAPYLFVYPFIKKREWYALPFEQRQEAMNDHVRIGREYPHIRINTTFCFGLDDPEFVVAFEGDSPSDFLDLVMQLRGSPASAFTAQDTPVFTCLQMSMWEVLDALGGASPSERAALTPLDADGYFPIGTVDELPAGSRTRVYLGTEAIAVFNVGGTFHAVSDRCTHGRASLSDGVVDPTTCVLECPWHAGKFDVRSGAPVGGPPQVPIKVFRVKVEGKRVLVG